MARKINKGKPLTELVKGSLEYTRDWINKQFRNQFPYLDSGPNYYVVDTFEDFVTVEAYSSELMPSEFFKVTYSKNGDAYTFAPRDQWEIVELAYQPATRASEAAVAESQAIPLSASQTSPQMEKHNLGGKKPRGTRIEERIDAQVVLEEREEGKPRRIRIEGAITANVVNGNRRRYPADVIGSAVEELKSHLNESAGQGRAIQLLGEAEHPSDKGGRANLLETVVKWDDVAFDGTRVDITGRILETSKGRDILTLMEGGVMPGVSLRGYGEGKSVGKGDDKVFEVTEIHLTGFDLVLEPSFENAAQLIESINQQGDEDMLEELKKLLAEQPELFGKGMTETQLVEMSEKQLKVLEEKIREALGLDMKANIVEALVSIKDKAFKFEDAQKQADVEKAIVEATKELPFGEKLNKLFAESFKGMEFKTAENVKSFAESQRKQYSQLAAAGVLVGMGFDEKTNRVQVIGDVLETETGTPNYARASFELTESIRKNDLRPVSDLRKREDRAAQFTMRLLERFDQVYQRKLMAEAQQFAEAELTTDLNLPYSVSRAIIAEAFPSLVAANVFDMGVIETSPTRLYYEAFAGETGYTVAITDEVETAGVEGTTYDLANKNIVPGTVVVTSNPVGTTYVEGTDFVIDYELGKITPLVPGSIGANDVLVSYSYNAIRKGENAEIERAKVTLSYQTIEATALRLADYISHEAIVFSRSQLGRDAIGRTMANLIRQVRRDIDRALIEKALAAALSVASNSGGTWDISDANYADLVAKLGVASALVANRYYQPTAILCSVTNAERLSNWTGFQRDGFPNALLSAAGFANMIVKGLPVFSSTQMRDTWFLVMNREIVMHRVFQPMTVKGPFPTYSNGKLVAAEQYYAEEYNASLAPIGGKASYVLTQA